MSHGAEALRGLPENTKMRVGGLDLQTRRRGKHEVNYGTPYHLPGQVRYKRPDCPEAKVPERETTLHSWLSDSDEGWPEGNWSDPDDPVPDQPTEQQIRESNESPALWTVVRLYVLL